MFSEVVSRLDLLYEVTVELSVCAEACVCVCECIYDSCLLDEGTVVLTFANIYLCCGISIRSPKSSRDLLYSIKLL